MLSHLFSLLFIAICALYSLSTGAPHGYMAAGYWLCMAVTDWRGFGLAVALLHLASLVGDRLCVNTGCCLFFGVTNWYRVHRVTGVALKLAVPCVLLSAAWRLYRWARQ